MRQVSIMNSKFLVIGVLLCLLAAVVPANAQSLDPQLESQLDEYMQPFVDLGVFSGSILLARDGEVIALRHYGYANFDHQVPVTEETIFHVASLTKSFTATAILLLQDRGLLSTADTLSTYLPDFPGADEITLEHLLMHRSGIANYSNKADYNQYSKSRHSLDDVIDWIKDDPRVGEPGQQFSYSNPNYILLARVIEIVSGKSYKDFMRSEVFEPLGMESTGSFMKEDVVENRADGYEPGPDGPMHTVWYDTSLKLGSGSAYSTIMDLYTYHSALQDGKLLSAESIQALHGKPYAWFARRADPGVVFTTGSSPGSVAFFWRDIKNDHCVIFVSNILNGLAFYHMWTDLPALVRGQEITQPELPKFNDELYSSRAVAPFIGRYASEDGTTMDIFIHEDNLFMSYNNGYIWAWLRPLSTTEYHQMNHNRSIIFNLEGEKAVSISWGSGDDRTTFTRISDEPNRPL